ncbi:MAG: hypothetical protein SVV80_07135, partial [Planctomycetota bacterium]|nr:hypothetical protein [Planctomycetota bacterium]
MTFAIVLYIILSVITDIVVFRYIGRWNRYNIFSPLRLLLLGMVVLLQVPAWITAIHPRIAHYESSVFAGLVSSAVAPLLVLLGSRLVGRPALTWRQWWQQPIFYSPGHKVVALVFAIGILLGIVLQFFIVEFRDVPLIANIFRRGENIEDLAQ